MTLLLCAVVKDDLSKSFLFSTLSQWDDFVTRIPADPGPIGIEFISGSDAEESVWENGPGKRDLRGYFRLIDEGEANMNLWLALDERGHTCSDYYEELDNFELTEGTIEEEAQRRLDDGEIDSRTLRRYFDLEGYAFDELSDEYDEINTLDGETFILRH